jgi:outer membrane scaffolding protein for murein synthesis (MipA/OmpV family)
MSFITRKDSHMLFTSVCARIVILSCLMLPAISFAQKSEESTETLSNGMSFRFFELSNSIHVYTPLFDTRDSYDIDREFFNFRFGAKWENGLFVNFGNFGTRGNGVGYNFYNTDDWEFDALIHLGFNSVEIGQDTNYDDFRAGIRATYYSEDAVFRVIASPIDINSDDDGFYLGSWYVKNWQIKNWNIHSIVGASYFSEEILDNRFSAVFFGPQEIGDYKAGAGIVFEFELGARYALGRDWVFEASIGQTVLPDAIYDNPFVDKRGQTYGSVGVVYVF